MTANVDMDEENDLYYHALNYRCAESQHAELFWKELEVCMNRLIAAEREACAKVCEDGGGYIVDDGAAAWCAAKIRTRSNAI